MLARIRCSGDTFVYVGIYLILNISTKALNILKSP